MRWSLILLLFVQSLQAQVFEYNTIQKGQWNGAGEAYSDVWGYAANGREYAIIGSARYIYFFDVTDPANIRLVDQFGPYTSTSWREFKTYGHYAYAVTDGPDAGGLRIFDLQNLPDTVVQVRQTTAFFGKCHMPFIDEANGRLYCAGTDTRNNGIIVLDLSVRPDSPSLIINQAMPRGYIHDVYVKNNVMYASHIYSGYISQYNCSGSSCTGELSTYQTTGYNHSSFMNADQTYLINAIETAGHPLWYFPINGDGTINGTNIKKFKSKTLREQYPAGPASDTGNIGHNPYIVGNLAYVSYYTDGVQVFDISNVNNIRRVAYFDTDRGHTAYTPVFRGCWGTYPFLPSGNILASDIQSGLWVFSLTPCAQNTPPSISISSSSSTYPTGSNIVIQATASDNGTISKVDFFNGTNLLFSDNSGPYTHTISNAMDPIYSISAKVYDDCGEITTSNMLSITTFAPDPCAGNTPPTISISSSSSSYVRGTSFTINANTSDNGTISKVDFYNGTSLIFSDSMAPYTHTILNALDPLYSISAKVYDDCGAITTSNTLSITTFTPDPCAGNTPPLISISSSSSSYVRGTSFTINATSSDNGTITKVNFYNNGVLIGTDLSSPYSLTINPANSPNYLITARSYDNCGDSSTSSVLNITTTVSCSDGIQNGSETGVDCGGSCAACACTSTTNLSLNKAASQSTTQNNTYRASRANDGIQSSSNYSRTRSATQNWWQVDLAANYKISSVIIRHRIGCSSCVGEIKRFRLFVTTSPVTSFNTSGYVYEYNSATGLGNGETLTIPVSNIQGRYIRIYVDNGTTSRAMSLAEVTVMGCSVPALIQADPHTEPYNVAKSKSLLVYPNPFADNITISLDRQPITNALIQVYDLQGRLIYTQSKQDKIITLHHMHPGTYILKAITDEGIYTSKIVKY